MKNRILVLNVEVSGMNKYLLTQLRKRGWNLSVIDIPFPKIYKFIALISTFRPNISEWKKKFDEKLGKLHKTAASFVNRSKYCRKALKKFDGKYDIVFQISGMFSPAIDYKKLDKPYVTYNDYTLMLSYTMALSNSYEGWAPLARERDRWLKLEKDLYKNARLIFTTNDNARSSLINDYGIENDKVVTVGYGLTLDKIPEYSKTYDGKTILFIGMDFERKGGFVLLEAFKEVRKSITDAKLIIVGPNKEILNINKPGVEMLGCVRDREVIDSLYKKASIFVMPSLCEPFGLVFLEAMAYKLPCIGTNTDAMPEIIEDEKTGFLVESNNAGLLAEKIISLLSNSVLLKSMGEEACKKAKEKFSWKEVGKKIDYHLKEVTNV